MSYSLDYHGFSAVEGCTTHGVGQALFLFDYGDFWHFLFALSVFATVVFWILSPRLSEAEYGNARTLLISCFVAILIWHALVSGAGLFVLGGRATVPQLLFLAAPLISPFLAMVSIVSVRWAAIAMWSLFTIVHCYLSWGVWPLYGTFILLSFDWPLWTAALFLSITVARDRQRLLDNARHHEPSL